MLEAPGTSPRVRRSPSDDASLRAGSRPWSRVSLRAFALPLLAAIALASAAAPGLAQTLTTDLYITNGPVITQALRDSVLYLGGSFSYVGPITGAGVPVDSVSALPTPNFPIVNGVVLTVIPDGTGGWFLGGQFTDIGNQPRANLAHVLSNGTVAAWDPGAGGAVRTLALRAGVLYVGGDFITLGGLPRNRIGAIDATTGAVTTWNPDANASVRSIVATTTQLFVGGQFTSIGGALRNRLAQLNFTTGAAIAGWDPNANGTVLSMSVDEVTGTIYVGGQFTFAGGITRNRIAAFETASGLVTDFNTGANNSVFTVVATPTSVYIGGQFTVLGITARNRLAAVDPSTGTPQAWNPDANNIVQSIAVSGNTVYVAGDFLTIGGQNRSRVAAIDAFSGLPTSWDPVAFGSVSVAAARNGKIFIGGSFNGVGGAPRSNLAAIDLRTDQVTSWAPNPDNLVNTLVAAPDRLYVGGTFTNLGGLLRPNLGAVDYTLGQATSWAPACNGPVNAISLGGSRLYVGGLFTALGGQPHSNLGAVNVTNGLSPAWTADVDDQVFAVEANGAFVRAGGNFLTANGQPRSFLAAFDTTTGATTAWNPAPNASVRTITTVCDKVYVGGTFTNIGGQPRNRAAELSGSSGVVQPWNPDANGAVFSIVPRPGVVYLGGVMTIVGGQSRPRVAAVDPVTAIPTAWNPSSNGSVRSLVADGSRVFVGGTFSTMAGLPSGNVAALSIDTSAPCATITFTPATLPNAPAGGAYSTSVTAIGGAGPYCYAITAGALPAGLSLDGATGQISGTSTTAGTANFTVTATDARGCTGSAAYSILTSAGGGMQFLTAPSAVVAGAPITPAVQVLVQDLGGTILAGQTVTLSLVGTGTLSGTTSAVSNASGVATFSGLSVNLAGSKQLTATSGTLPNITSSAFVVSAGPAATLAFNAQPTNVVAGAAITPAVSVHATDAFGNNVAGASVALALIGTGTLTGGAAQPTDANGNAVFNALSVNLAGSKQLSASSGALTPVTSAAFTVSAGPAATVAFSAQPSNVAAGATIAPAVKVRVTDASGNNVAGASVSLALVGTGTLTGGTAVVTDTAGTATFAALSVNLAGSKQLTATSGALPPATSTAFTVSAGPATTLAFTVQPSNAAAGAAIAPAVKVRATDAFGNNVTGASVSLALVGTGALTGGGATATDTTGTATFAALSVNLAGSKQLTASSGALTPVTSTAFTIAAGPAATLAFAVQPTNAAAGAAITPAVQVRATDAFGNNVTGASVSLALVGTGTLTGGGAQLTDATGLATFSTLSVNLAGSKQLTASSGALTPVTSTAFTVSAGAASVVAFAVQPSNVAAGASITPAVQVRVSDAFGNGIPGSSVSLALVGTGTLTGGGATLTDAAGLATFSALSVDLAGSKQLTATSGALTPATSTAFTVSAGPATTLAFAVQPTNVAAGAAITPAVQVRATDAFGNNVTGASVSLALVGTGTLTGGGAQLTNASGVATFSALSINLAGSKQLSASSGALTPATSAAFTVSAGPAATLAFTVQPTNVAAGATITPAVKVRATDAFGNNVAGASVSLALVGTGTLTGGAAVVTDTAGTATFAALSVNLAGSKQLTATSGVLTPATSAAFTVSAGPAATVAFSVQPSNVAAGAAITPAVQVRVTDAFGNGVSGSSVSLALVGTGTLTGGAAKLTDANGNASFAALSVDLAGSKQLTATSGALTPATSTAFTVSAGPAATLAFAVQPTNAAAGAAITPAVQVRATDAFGNNVTGASVSLALVGTGTLTGGGAQLTNASGLATFSTLSVNLAGSKQLTASSGALTPVTSTAFTVAAGPAAALTFAVQPTNVAAGATITPAVQVRVADAFGNPIAGSSVSLALLGTGVLTGGGAQLSDAAGLATFNALSIDLAGSKQLSASSGVLTPATSAAFTVASGAVATLAFAVQPTNVAAGASIAPAVQVHATDALGNDVAGASVSLALVGTGTLTGGGAQLTNASGIATFSALSVNLVGSKQLSATSGALTPVASAAFNVTPGPAATLTFAVQPTTAGAGVPIAPAVQVHVADAFGNDVAGASVSLTLVGTGTLSGATPQLTSATGLATFSALSIDQTGAKQLSASTGVLTPVASAAFDITPGPAATLTFQTQPTNSVAGVAISPAVRVRVADALGNAVPGISVSLALLGSGTLSGTASGASDATGLVTFAGLSIDLAGSKQLSASSGTLPSATSASFTIAPATASVIAFQTQPTDVAVGATITPAVLVHITDAFGNNIVGRNVGLSLVGGGTLTGGGAHPTDANGIATFNALSTTSAGLQQLQASSGVLSATSASFRVTPGPAAALSFATPPSDVAAAAAIAPAVRVLVADSFGNGVAGSTVSLALVGTGTLNGAAPVLTDTSGIATFASLSVATSGSKQLTASSGALSPVTSAAFTVSPGPAVAIAFQTQPSNAAAGVPVSPAVQVLATDAFGNPVPGTSITLALSGTGTLSGAPVTPTGANGLATFASLSVDQAGSKTLLASSGALLPAQSAAFTISAGPAALLAFATPPSAVTAGDAITPGVRVHVTDAFGNDVAGAPVALSLIGTGVLTGGTARPSDAAGIATFDTLRIDLAGSKQLSASSGALTPATSASFAVSPAAATTVSFTAQPGNVVAGASIAPAVQVKVSDAFGNGIPGNSVALSLVGTGTLTGGGSILTNASGIASFAALSVNLAGSKQLTATSGTLPPATSTAFNVSAAAAAAVTFSTQPSDAVAGVAIAPAVRVHVADAFGNDVAGSSVALALVGTGTLTGGGAQLTDATGTATFSTLSVNLAGSKQVSAAVGALTPVTSTAFNITPAAAATVAFTAQPSNVVAGVSIAPAVAVKVSDAFGNGIAGNSVALALVGTGTLTGGAPALTDANGVATFAALSVNLAGSKQLTATSGALTPATSTAFIVSAGPAATLAFTTPPSNVAAGAPITPAVQVHVTDAFGNDVAGSGVTLALVGTGTLTGGGSTPTDAAGLATFSNLRINTAGTKQLTATSGAATPLTSLSFDVTPAVPAALAFSTQPTNAVAGVAIAPAVRVHVTDALGNDVPGASVALALVGSGTLTGGAPALTDAAGIATFNALSIDLAGSKQLSASVGALTPVTSTAFSITPAAAATIAFTAQPSNVVAGVAIAPAVAVKVADAFGNGVPGSSVALSLVGSGTLTGGGAVLTNASGIASFAALSVNLAGAKQLTATSGALTPATSSAFNVTAAAAATVAFSTQPSNAVAGVVIAPAVRVRVTDAFGNDVAGSSVALALVGTGTLTGGGAQLTDAAGTATFSTLSVNLAGSKQLTATVGALTPVTSTAFSITPAAAATIAFTAQPSNVVAGASIAPAVQVKVSDAFGNGIAGNSVALSLVGTGTLTGGGAVLTNASGIASFAALSVNLAGAKQLTATSGALTPATSTAFNVSAAAAATVAFSTQPSNAVAGVAIAPAVRVRVTDAFGNDVAGSSVALALVGTGTLTGGAAQLTDATGTATFPALSVNLAGSKQLTATVGALTPVTSAAFSITPAAAATVAFTAQPSNVVAGVSIAPAVQVKVSDAFGNGIAGNSVALSLVGTGTLTGGAPALTDASGIASFAALSVNLAGSKQLTATSGALTPATSTAFNVSAAAAASIAFSTQPSNAVAGAAITPAVTVQVADAFGNGVSGRSVALALVGTGTLTGGAPALTDANGIATFSTLSVDLAGSKQLTASNGALPPATSSAFTISAAAASVISFAVQPSNVVAGATIAPAVQVKVADAFGNGVSGRSVTLALIGSGALTGGGAVLTDASGLAAFPALSVNLAGAKQLTASNGALTPATSTSFNVTAATAATVAFTTQPSAVVAGVAIAPAVTVKVADSFGNGIAGSSVSLALVGTGTLTGGAPALTDANGVATFAALSLNLTGAKQLTATSGALTPATSTSFNVTAAAAASVAFTTQPSSAVAGVAIAPAVRVQVSDAFGNGVPGSSVALALVGTGTLTGGAAQLTDASGAATFSTLSINLAGAKQLTATVGALTPATSASFNISAAAAATVAFTTQPSNAVAGAVLAPAVVVKVSDAFGNGIAGSSVALALTGSGTLTGGAAQLTGAAGTATFNALSINLSGSKQLTASSGVLTPATSASFTISPAAPASIAFAVQPSNVVAGAAITPAVQVKVSDAFGNGVPGSSVALALTGTGSLTGGAAVLSDANGLATFAALSVNLVGAKQLTASSGLLTPATSTSFNVSAAAAATLAFATQPSNVGAGTPITPAVRVQVSDAFGNAVAGSPVSLALVGTGTLSGAAPTASDASGIATFASLSIDLLGSKQLTASSGAATPVTSVAFTVTTGPAATLTFITQPSNTTAGASIAPAVRVRVADAFGNTISGASVALSLIGTGTLSGTTTIVSDANGISRFPGLNVDLAGSKQLAASTGALGPVPSAAFTISPAAASVVSFVTQPTSVVAGASMTPAVSVKVADAFGNGIAASSVSLSLVGTGVLTGGAAVPTDANGIATFNALSVNLAGSKQLSAASGALTPATSASFNVSAAAAAALSFATQPSNVAAGATIAPAVRVLVSDAFGNPVSGRTVALSLTGSGVLTGGAGVPSDASGIATFNALSINLAGSKQLTAASGLLTPVNSASFTVTSGAAATLAFSTQPTNVVAGANMAPAVRVHVTDALGNDVAGAPVALSLIGTGVLSGGGSVLTDATGTATFGSLLLNLVGSKQLSASSGALTPVTSTSFTVSAAAPSALSFATQPSNVVAGATMSPAVRVHLTDAFGNAIVGSSISLTLTGTGTLTGGGATLTDAGGIATFAALSLGSAGSKQLNASSGALTPVASTSFTVSAAGASTVAFTVQPSSFTAGATMSPAVQVRVTDAFGNNVPGAPVTLALLGTGTLSGAVGVSTDASGIATFAALSIQTTGTKRLTATAGALAPVSSQPFSVTAGPATAIAFSVQPSDAIAGTALTPTVAVRVTDALGNGVPASAVTLSLTSPPNPPSGPSIGDAATFSAPVEAPGSLSNAAARLPSGLGPVNTDSTGTARFPSLRIDVAGSHLLQAASGTLSPATSHTFVISPAAPSVMRFTVQPSDAAVNQVLSPPVQVRVEDAFGNAVPNTLVSLALAAPGAISGGGATPTDGNGFATFAALSIGTPGPQQLVASSGALTPVTSLTFQIACPAVTLSPDTLVTGTAGIAYSATFSASGGVSPYTFAVTAGALPSGLTLSASGALTGSPTAPGLASFTVTATGTLGCKGSRAYTLRVLGLPAAIADLTASRVAGPGDGDGTQPIRITFTLPAFADSVEVYRAPFGGYPRFDDAGGSAPPTPGYPPAAPWVRTAITASGQQDEVATRDAYRYIAFSRNSAGQRSPGSNVSAEVPNYLLGDVSNGSLPGKGDNRVDFADVSLLGAHYGISGAALVNDGVSYLDIGPTVDHTMATRPATDGRIDFEDLIVLVTNYGAPTTPSALRASADGMLRNAQARERFTLDAPVSVRGGETFTVTVRLEGAGRIQGARVSLGWNESLVEPVQVKGTAWVQAQDGVVFSAAPGQVDAALLGIREQGFSGDGELAVVTFRALRAGEPDIRLASVEARDAANRPLGADLLDNGVRAAVAPQTLLFAPAPNPCRAPATLGFSLAKAGRADLALYSVDGRRVRTIASGMLEAGTHQYVWTGEDDARRKVAPGVYFARLVTDGPRFTRKLVLLP